MMSITKSITLLRSVEKPKPAHETTKPGCGTASTMAPNFTKFLNFFRYDDNSNCRGNFTNVTLNL